MRLLSSQYAERGKYDIEERSLEILPDGRMIIGGDRVWSDGFQDECLGLDGSYEE
jgi:hypothetical protein